MLDIYNDLRVIDNLKVLDGFKVCKYLEVFDGIKALNNGLEVFAVSKYLLL